MPRLRASFGVSTGARSLRGMRFATSVEHDDDYHRLSYDGGKLTMRPDPAVSGFANLESDITGYVSRHLYVGFHMGFGGGPVSGSGTTAGTTPLSLMNVEIGTVTGASLTIGNWIVRPEAITGWRALGLTLESKQGDCVATSTAWRHELMLTPKISVDRWLTPWSSLGVSVGTDALRPGREVQFGLTLTGHVRSFDALLR